jgi:hypothetical protein
MAQSSSNSKPTTEYHDAGIPNGETVWIAGFGQRGSGWRNHTNAMPIEQSPSYDDDLTNIDVPVFRNMGGNDNDSDPGNFKTGIKRA